MLIQKVRTIKVTSYRDFRKTKQDHKIAQP